MYKRFCTDWNSFLRYNERGNSRRPHPWGLLPIQIWRPCFAPNRTGQDMQRGVLEWASLTDWLAAECVTAPILPPPSQIATTLKSQFSHCQLCVSVTHIVNANNLYVKCSLSICEGSSNFFRNSTIRGTGRKEWKWRQLDGIIWNRCRKDLYLFAFVFVCICICICI